MENITPLFIEMQSTYLSLSKTEEERDELNKVLEKLRERRELLDFAHKTLIENEGMTMVQAKMIAHQEMDNRIRKATTLQIYRVPYMVDEVQGWSRFLRRVYRFLGGK